MSQRETAYGKRRSSAFADTDEARYLRFEDLVVDLSAYRVRLNAQEIELGPIEYRLLCFFLRHPSKALTREEMIEAVWPKGTTIDVRTVDVHIARMRRSLTQYGHSDPIRTVWSVGYVLG